MSTEQHRLDQCTTRSYG